MTKHEALVAFATGPWGFVPTWHFVPLLGSEPRLLDIQPNTIRFIPGEVFRALRRIVLGQDS